MAEIVLGLATSHGPMLSTPPEEWHQRVLADRAARHPFRGDTYDFDQLVALRAPEHFEREITLDVWRRRHAACQAALAELARVYAEVPVDAAIIIGDDQMEIFSDFGVPAFSVYHGARIENVPFSEEQLARLPPGVAIAEPGHHGLTAETYTGQPSLAEHLIASLLELGFDPGAACRLPSGGDHAISGIPHAYGFVFRQIMKDHPVPTVPVFINTFYPPNQPSARRCYAFGKALARSIRSWKGGGRVAVVASGGMSHFVIDETFDRDLLGAMMARDESTFLEFPETLLQSGTSEVKNWIALAGALLGTGLDMRLVDYVPCYRSEAGTGTAQGFAYWR